MKSLICAALVLILSGSVLLAENPAAGRFTQSGNPCVKGKSLGLNIGTVGPGLEFGLKFSERLGARAKISYFQYTNYPYAVYVSKTKVMTNTTVKLGMIELIADFHPFKTKIFRLSAGPVLYLQNQLNFSASLTEGVAFKDMVLNPEEVGAVNGEIKWKRAGAYLGLGVGRTVPNARWGVGFDLGCYYLGSPDLKLGSTERLSPSNDQEQVIEDNISSYSILPYLNIRLAYKLSK